MQKIIACITQQHDIRLVFLAGVVCLLACLTAFNLIARSRGTSSPRERWLWITGAAIVAGCGVWATHFVAMLAYRPGLPLGYDVGLTIVSVVIAVAIIGLGCAIGLAGAGWAALGGGIAGAGIGAMHYAGMAALRIAAEVAYDPIAVALSVAIGVVLGACAFYVRENRLDLRGGVYAALVFALAIVSLHFTGMSAVTLTPDVELSILHQVTSPEWLAVAVAAVTLMIIILSFAGSVIDQHLAERNEHEAARLRAHVIALEMARQEHETTGASLRDALDRADAGNRAKSQFLATMSHELRTPLNAVIGFADLIATELHGPIGDPRYREYLTCIRDSGAHLLALISDVLDFAKIDAGKLTLAEDEISIPELFAEARRMVEPTASEAGLTLREELPQSELPHLRADHRRVKQVLLNLLSNAIKFTPAPGVVSISARGSGRDLVIAVFDTGIGMAQADVPRALEPFGQIDNSFVRTYQGTGLGLSLSKQLMELHDGSLGIESMPGRGTLVTLTFPAERVMWPEASESGQSNGSAEPREAERLTAAMPESQAA